MCLSYRCAWCRLCPVELCAHHCVLWFSGVVTMHGVAYCPVDICAHDCALLTVSSCHLSCGQCLCAVVPIFGDVIVDCVSLAPSYFPFWTVSKEYHFFVDTESF